MAMASTGSEGFVSDVAVAIRAVVAELSWRTRARAARQRRIHTERYGAAGEDFKACTYQTDPTRPIGRRKEAREAAEIRAGLQCRFHDRFAGYESWPKPSGYRITLGPYRKRFGVGAGGKRLAWCRGAFDKSVRRKPLAGGDVRPQAMGFECF
jgi:hypothetical protein